MGPTGPEEVYGGARGYYWEGEEHSPGELVGCAMEGKVGLKENCSWLGRFKDGGWSIKIEPRLTPEQWEQFGLRAEETWFSWTEGPGEYNVGLNYNLLKELFPEHKLSPYRPRPEQTK